MLNPSFWREASTQLSHRREPPVAAAAPRSLPQPAACRPPELLRRCRRRWPQVGKFTAQLVAGCRARLQKLQDRAGSSSLTDNDRDFLLKVCCAVLRTLATHGMHRVHTT